MIGPSIFHNIIRKKCHELLFRKYCRFLALRSISAISLSNYTVLCLGLFLSGIINAQVRTPVVSGPQPMPLAVQPLGTKRAPLKRISGPSADEIRVQAVTQDAEGSLRKLRGAVEIETTEFLLKADEVDYDEETKWVEARGNVFFQNFDGGEEIHCERAQYNMEEESGRFYAPKGKAPAKIEARRGVLSSTNPFIFEGHWAEKIKDRYILYDGFVTNCKLPKPWWRLTGPKIDIIPGDRAIAYRSYFKVRKVPVLYAPAFYKSLEKLPRRSGLLTPSAGVTTRFGKVISAGYFWAINRSYDLTYRGQFYTQRGLRNHIDFRGKPNDNTSFNFIFEGIKDRGKLQDNGERLKQGGYLMTLTAQSALKYGFEGHVNANYLSSFTYRQAFSQSYNEAIYSENNAIGYLSKNWDTYSFHFIVARHQVFGSEKPDDQVVISKLPSFEFNSRDKQINEKVLPVWVSFESSASLLRRQQPLFQTRAFMDRLDVAPRIMTAFRFGGFSFLPSLSARETHYSERKDPTTFQVTGENINRRAIEFGFDMIPPSVERTYDAPKWLGEKLKHVIEPRASFRYVSGVRDFNQLIRFDQTDLISNTKEAEISLTNRFFTKRNGNVEEVFTWQLWQRRYFDPDFGGALQIGQRNVLQSTNQLTAYGFLDQRRNYSPIVSAARAKPLPWMGMEWRADYDPLRGIITNTGFTVDARKGQVFAAFGHNKVAKIPLLSPEANQIVGRIGYGNEQHKGWNTGFNAVYDYRQGILQYAVTQVSYNTDCCGISIQWRRFSIPTRNDNQYLFSFAVANIGTFGTLRKQERLF